MKEMNALKQYDIKFAGLKNGKHQYKFHLTQKFFSLFDFDEYNESDIDILIDLTKRDNLLEFLITSQGSVNVPCDVSGENFDQNFSGNLEFIVNFGEEFNDDREDLIILPYHSHTFNIAQQIYESVLLNVPVKRIHPDIASGKIAPKHIINYSDEIQSEEKKEIDPRWAALKKIVTDKK